MGKPIRNMTGDNFYILSGAPGSGKTTLLQRLRKSGYQVIEEPARRVLAEQRSIDGNGIPGRDDLLFVDLMLSRAIEDFCHTYEPTAPVFFDRGIADNLAYASLFGFDHPRSRVAAETCRYENGVFFLPALEQIYTLDDERKMPFS